jgi:cell division GTPase FtsZ
VPTRAPDPGGSRRPGRSRRDDDTALVTAAITAAERSVAVEAITCAIAGNTVRITPNRLRSTLEIFEIVEVVAAELDSEVRVITGRETVEVRPPIR